MSTKNFKSFGTQNTERVGIYDLNSYNHYLGGVNWLAVGGQVEYLSPGSYSWTCPPNVTSVSVVCVGAGGGGGSSWAVNGGSGGGLGYKNNIAVTPGQSYSVFVGTKGTRGANPGQTSYFIDVNTVAGKGGNGQAQNNSTYGGYVGDGGGMGGSSTGWGGGGGAGGYAGDGGATNSNATTNSGAGAGGRSYSSTYGTGAGGGVGIYGIRTDYTAQTGRGYGTSTGRGGTPNNASASFSGGGGQGGSTRTGIISGELTGYSGCQGENNTGYGYNGSSIHGGYPGGGGGGPGTSYGGGHGADGAVRIMWASEGQTRAYPGTNCEDLQ